MSLQITTNINVDFYDNQYIMVNAKQYDGSSRWIAITCYNQGSLYNISASKHTAYIRCRKADEHTVLNSCKINYKGEILVELTEQMLAVDGICYVDLIIVNKGKAIVNIDTGEIITIDDSPIISTMAFCINVYESPIDDSIIESTDEYNAFGELFEKANAEYQEVIQLAKSYAVGDADDIRENEDNDNSKYYSKLSRSYAIGDADGVRKNENTDNAKYYSEQSSNSADAAADSEANALEYMNDTNEYMGTTQGYMNTAKDHMDATNSYMGITKGYMEAAEGHIGTVEEYMTTTNKYMDAAEEHMNSAKGHMETAQSYMNNAITSEINAANSETSAKTSETNALNSANFAKSYTVGGTGTRDGEDKDNTQYYYGLVKSIVDGLNSGFIPMGTITFSELATAEKATGFTYNISDDFITDDTFKEGAGKSYTAGTNAY